MSLAYIILLASAFFHGVSVRVVPQVASSPADVMVQVHLVPEAGDAVLEVVAEASDFFRASGVHLDGVDSPNTHIVQWHAFPAGEYEVFARVLVRGHVVRAESARVKLLIQ